MDIIVPKIQSKYITAFKNESSYDAAYPTFEEVNWSAIKPAVGPEELPDEYRLSRRLSHMYAGGTPPDYKFSSVDEYVPYDAQTEEEKTYADARQIAHHNTEGCLANQMTPDDIRKTFFLEIIWGYSGWEWHDYNIHEEHLNYTDFIIKDKVYGKYMNITTDGVFISDNPQILHIVNEEEHVYVTDGTYYIAYNGSNLISSTTEKLPVTVIKVNENGIDYLRFKEPFGYVGINYPTTTNCINQNINDQALWAVEYINESPYETIAGGNLYKIKDIETVPHIIDGVRLYHINNFLNSQTNVKLVEDFYVDNIKAINGAFKRINRNNGYNLITPCQLNVYEFPNVAEADELFFNNKISIIGGNAFNMPALKEVNKLYSQGAFTEGLKFKMESLEKMTNCFAGAYFNQPVINLNSIFEGTTLSKVTNFEGMFYTAGLYGHDIIDGEDSTIINFDLTGNSVPASSTINLNKFVSCVGVCGHNETDNTGAAVTGFTSRRLIINLDFNNKVTLAYALAGAMKQDKSAWETNSVTNQTIQGIGNTLYYDTTSSGIPYSALWYRNGSFNKVTFNLNNKESLVKDISYFGAFNTFIENLPITARCNADCNDDYIYYRAIFDAAISYDFSPTQSLSYYYSQFNGANIKTGFTFTNLDCLKSIDFRNTKFPVNNTDPNNPVYTTFPYVLNNPNYTYNQDGSRYQNISFEGSNLGGFTVQDFYLRLGNALSGVERDRKAECEWQLISNSCFKNMPNVDFTANHRIYIETPKLDVTGNVNYSGELFNGCTSMTTTPNIYFNVDLNNFTGNLFYFRADWFVGCNNLVEVNMENVELVRSASRGYVFSGFHFTSPNLVYLRLGNCQVTDIYISSKILDIPTFVQTLLNQDGSVVDTNLHITNAVYAGLQAYDSTHGTNIVGEGGHCSRVFRTLEHKENI